MRPADIQDQDPGAYAENQPRQAAIDFIAESGAEVSDVVEVAGKRWLVTEAGPEEVAE